MLLIEQWHDTGSCRIMYKWRIKNTSLKLSSETKQKDVECQGRPTFRCEFSLQAERLKP
jgi:hypothetical protein